MRIIVIDDNAFDREYLASRLGDAWPDVTVVAPCSWSEAEDAIRDAPPRSIVVSDGFLIDWRMWPAPYKTARDVFGMCGENVTTRCLCSSDPDQFPDVPTETRFFKNSSGYEALGAFLERATGIPRAERVRGWLQDPDLF